MSLGVISGPVGILTMAASLAFTIIAAWAINRLLGEPLPGEQAPGEEP